MHRPEDEKRMVVILPEKDYGTWLSCPVEEAPRFFKQYHGPLHSFAAPLPPRAKRPSTPKRAPPDEGDLVTPFE
jgi:hypothetical protein